MVNQSGDIPTAKKRGRKPKKVLTSEDVNAEETVTLQTSNENIIVTIEAENNETNGDSDNEKNLDNGNCNADEQSEEDKNKPVAKKRGRKPKGGKIVHQVVSSNDTADVKPNVIMHLKCFLRDLNNNLLNEDLESFTFTNMNMNNSLLYSKLDDNKISFNECVNDNIYADEPAAFENSCEEGSIEKKDGDIREIWKKLKALEYNLHINNISDKKSACFWCTCDFDNPPIYIPKYYMKDTYHVYGCFCSPECATAYLMEENIDSSVKFERYHLINNIYSKIYNYNKNIKPAPNPYYMLEKYYGNLSIQEYRALLKNERLFLIVDKPLTRILPELHEDNDDFIINNKIIPSNAYQIKKKTLQKRNQTKTNILSERFGLATNN